MRSKYWSNSKIADLIRGTPSPRKALSSKDWRNWHKLAKLKPFRYWLAETALSKAQKFFYYIPDKLGDVKYYIRNRFIIKTHMLQSNSLKKGQWHEFDTRVFNSVFDSFIDFVEIEVAGSHLGWNYEDKDKYNLPWWWNNFIARMVNEHRCPMAGVDHLIWEAGLVYNIQEFGADFPKLGQYTHQAIAAQEKLSLYIWWKFVRPNRPDAMDLSGYSKYVEDNRQMDDGSIDSILALFDDEDTSISGEYRANVSELLDKCRDIEENQLKEDQEMFIRLIKILPHCWT